MIWKLYNNRMHWSWTCVITWIQKEYILPSSAKQMSDLRLPKLIKIRKWSSALLLSGCLAILMLIHIIVQNSCFEKLGCMHILETLVQDRSILKSWYESACCTCGSTGHVFVLQQESLQFLDSHAPILCTAAW